MEKMELKIELLEEGFRETKTLPMDEEEIGYTAEVYSGKIYDRYRLFEVNDLGFEVVHHVGTLEDCQKLQRMLESSFDEEDE